MRNMALQQQQHFLPHTGKTTVCSLRRRRHCQIYASTCQIYASTQLPGKDPKDTSINNPSPGRLTLKTPLEEFLPPGSTLFQRRFLVGVGTASLVALGANFVGITSLLLGISPQIGRNLKLDVIYSIQGYDRCLETNEGFEFIYPANWVRDQTIFYRAIGRAESQRSLDPPSLNDPTRRLRRNLNEPIIAFGPPGSNGELNVSVIVSPVPTDFSIEAFGGPKEVGEAVVRTITGSSRKQQSSSDVKATLIEATLREDAGKRNLNYYKLEFRVESSSFHRHNIAVCCANGGRLFTLNAQAPESVWLTVKEQFNMIADSFMLTS